MDVVMNKHFTIAEIENSRSALATTDFGAEVAGAGAFDANSTNFANHFLGFGAALAAVGHTCAMMTVKMCGCELADVDVAAIPIVVWPILGSVPMLNKHSAALVRRKYRMMPLFDTFSVNSIILFSFR